METVVSVKEMQSLGAELRTSSKRVALVPTMGAVHEGHLSLLRLARDSADIVVASIFVNPLQFGPSEDFEKYPRDPGKDSEALSANGCSVLFAPAAADMYAHGFSTFVDVGKAGERLCGVSRPGHFRGVATVVLKLFNIVGPDIAVFGQKDAQQVMVIKTMVRELNCGVRIVVGPTVREPDGLAMSSRNRYLSREERLDAPKIFQGLRGAAHVYEEGERKAARLRDAVASVYARAKGFTPEYIEIVDLVEAQPVEMIGQGALIAAACRTTETHTRLIDNVVVGGEL
jgi:pantoate--beta-alanine ligase